MNKKSWWTVGIILAVIVPAIIVLRNPEPAISKKTAQCIGENSILYVQLGCHACEIQENLFGETTQYLTIVDCFFEREKCAEITYTPTWIINNQEYIGVQSIEKLKELTNCP